MVALKCFCEEPMTLEPESEEWYATSCGHMFHYLCLMKWRARSDSCPQCRKEVNDENMFRLYPCAFEETPKDESKEILENCLDETQKKMEEAIDLCRKKDTIIKDMQGHADNDKNFKLENEALKHILETCDTATLDELFSDTENFDRVLLGKMALLGLKKNLETKEMITPMKKTSAKDDVDIQTTDAQASSKEENESDVLKSTLMSLREMTERISELRNSLREDTVN